MPITIKGIRVTSITVTREEEGGDKINCDYQLLSSDDRVLAKQSLSTKSQYGSETVFVPPSDVLKLVSDAVSAYRTAIEQHLGIT